MSESIPPSTVLKVSRYDGPGPGLIKLALYIGVGAFCHLWRVGPDFSWASMKSVAWLMGWPLGVIGLALPVVGKWLLWALAAVVALLVIIFVGYWIVAATRPWRQRRMQERFARDLKREMEKQQAGNRSAFHDR